MKITVACGGKKLSDRIDPRFGRCNYFLIVNPKNNKFKVIKNTATQSFRGAGISAAQLVANQGVQVAIAGNFGPKAVMALNSSGVEIFKAGSDLTVKQAVTAYQRGNLEKVNG